MRLPGWMYVGIYLVMLAVVLGGTAVVRAVYNEVRHYAPQDFAESVEAAIDAGELAAAERFATGAILTARGNMSKYSHLGPALALRAKARVLQEDYAAAATDMREAWYYLRDEGSVEAEESEDLLSGIAAAMDMAGVALASSAEPCATFESLGPLRPGGAPIVVEPFDREGPLRGARAVPEEGNAIRLSESDGRHAIIQGNGGGEVRARMRLKVDMGQQPCDLGAQLMLRTDAGAPQIAAAILLLDEVFLIRRTVSLVPAGTPSEDGWQRYVSERPLWESIAEIVGEVGAVHGFQMWECLITITSDGPFQIGVDDFALVRGPTSRS